MREKVNNEYTMHLILLLYIFYIIVVLFKDVKFLLDYLFITVADNFIVS